MNILIGHLHFSDQQRISYEFHKFYSNFEILENIKNLTAWTHCQCFINYWKQFQKWLKIWQPRPTCHGFNNYRKYLNKNENELLHRMTSSWSNPLLARMNSTTGSARGYASRRVRRRRSWQTKRRRRRYLLVTGDSPETKPNGGGWWCSWRGCYIA
jgi:hypothetical protein